MLRAAAQHAGHRPRVGQLAATVKTGDWNAASYDKVADPQARWGAEVLARLPLEGDETVLDAGCGTGRVTELLLARLPRGRVVALDASAAMLEQARGRLARFGDQVEYVQADLERPLPIAEPVDAVLSTATFHWVLDHDALFANLAPVLRPGGWLVAQCGGFGNVATLLRVAKEVHPGFRRVHNFQTAEATRERLERSGFDRHRDMALGRPDAIRHARAVRGIPRDRLPSNVPR